MTINNIYAEIFISNYSTPTDKMANMCLEIITKLYPIYENTVNTVDDAFLIASALNYLNAYVKIPNSNFIKVFQSFYKNHPEISKYLIDKGKEHGKIISPYIGCKDKTDAYKCFKKLVVPFMYKLEEKFPNDAKIKVSPQLDNGSSLVLIEIYNVQFSFHRVPIYQDTNEKYYKMMNDHSSWIKWKGLRLQPIATNVLKCATKLDNLSEENKNIINKNTNEDILEK